MPDEKEDSTEEAVEGLGDFLTGLAKHMEEQENHFIQFHPGEPQEDMPISVDKIKFVNGGMGRADYPSGQPVAVRWCSETEKDEEGQEITRFGYYLGDLPVSQFAAFDKRDNTLGCHMHTNPAIFVPSLGRVVWGMESWWGPIEDEAGLRKITDKSISDLWYVKALKEHTDRERERRAAEEDPEPEPEIRVVSGS